MYIRILRAYKLKRRDVCVENMLDNAEMSDKIMAGDLTDLFLITSDFALVKVPPSFIELTLCWP
jgi:hypothetical protein